MSFATPVEVVAQQQKNEIEGYSRNDKNQNNPGNLSTTSNKQTDDVSGGSRRTRVYGDIIKKWREAAELAAVARGGPRPRSSHDRVLGGQALSTRQRQRSLSTTSQDSWSWGNTSTSGLRDTISPAAKLAWREELFRRKLERLAKVPMAVLLRQASYDDSDTATATAAGAVVSGHVGGRRVIAAGSHLSPELIAHKILEGTCLEVMAPASLAAPSLQPKIAAAGSTSKARVMEGCNGRCGRGRGSGGGSQGMERAVYSCAVDGNGGRDLEPVTTDTAQTVGTIRGEESSRSVAAAAVTGAGCRKAGVDGNITNNTEAAAVAAAAITAVKSFQQTATETASKKDVSNQTISDSTSELTGTRQSRQPSAPVEIPTRGFHVVDLHAVVRNFVEWNTWLAKVEPVFRVGDNRDTVLLGLVHVLGSRLCCSSKHDIEAGAHAAKSASQPIQAASPLRLLDRHVCRPPPLLRAAATAGVSLYEVDCMDELCRIAAARRRTTMCPTRPPPAVFSGGSDHEQGAAVAAKGASAQEQAAGGSGGGSDTAEALIRLALPSRRLPRGIPGAISFEPFATEDENPSASLEVDSGASVDDVLEIVQRVTTTSATLRSSGSKSSSRNGNQGEDNTIGNTTAQTAYANVTHNPLTRFFPSIVGFSIDVGQACLDDAIAAEVEAADAATAGTRPPDSVRDNASGVGTSATPAAIRLPPGEEVASLKLSEDIDTAIAFAVEVARRATDSVTAACAALDVKAAAVNAEERTSHEGSLPPGGGYTTKTPAPRFQFCRLHITGLGNGGARGEPLAALKMALSRHLPTISVAVATGSNGGGLLNGRGSGIDRSFTVSADATEYLVAGGVWSTVASIIGRKKVLPPNSNGQIPPLLPPQPPCAGLGRDTITSENQSRADEETPTVEKTSENGGECSLGSGAMYYIDDGCYGSLSGALLRAEPMQPLPLVRPRHRPIAENDKTAISSSKLWPHGVEADVRHQQQQDVTKTTRALVAPDDDIGSARPPPLLCAHAPCTVWGPTCDGLDCVSRVTPLPAEMEPGRDWLFFPERGMRAGADVSGFNGLKSLDAFYCIRQSLEMPLYFSSSVR